MGEKSPVLVQFKFPLNAMPAMPNSQHLVNNIRCKWILPPGDHLCSSLASPGVWRWGPLLHRAPSQSWGMWLMLQTALSSQIWRYKFFHFLTKIEVAHLVKTSPTPPWFCRCVHLISKHCFSPFFKLVLKFKVSESNVNWKFVF